MKTYFSTTAANLAYKEAYATGTWCVVLVVHAVQGGVAPGLQGQMEVGAQIGKLRRPGRQTSVTVRAPGSQRRLGAAAATASTRSMRVPPS